MSRVNSGHSVMSETVFRAPASTLHQPASPLSQHFLQPAAQAFKACMCDLDELHPSKLAINLFSKNIIDEATFESIQESMKSPVKDEMVLRTEILRTVYNALKVDARLSASLQQALKKLNPESAGKFASEMSKWCTVHSLWSSPVFTGVYNNVLVLVLCVQIKKKKKKKRDWKCCTALVLYIDVHLIFNVALM